MRRKILEEAAAIVTKDRNTDYGEPEDSFRVIAHLWQAYLGAAIRPRDVAVMMILLKVARLRHGDKLDNWVDIAGYAACGGEIDNRAKSAELVPNG